jgi:hypothetical protein
MQAQPIPVQMPI